MAVDGGDACSSGDPPGDVITAAARVSQVSPASKSILLPKGTVGRTHRCADATTKGRNVATEGRPLARVLVPDKETRQQCHLMAVHTARLGGVGAAFVMWMLMGRVLQKPCCGQLQCNLQKTEKQSPESSPACVLPLAINAGEEHVRVRSCRHKGTNIGPVHHSSRFPAVPRSMSWWHSWHSFPPVLH